MSNIIKIKRGQKSNLSTAGVADGELKYTKDTKELFIGDDSENIKIGGDPINMPISTATQTALNTKANIADLATVATSGDYNDLSNKPIIPVVNDGTLTIKQNGTTIDTFTANSSADKEVDITVPTKVSDLTNDSNFQTDTQVSTAINAHHDNTKQDTLVSATNIKTINNNSILGSGNLNIETEGLTVVSHDDTLTGSGTNDSQLKTVGFKDINTNNTLKTWTGTKTQYDAITTKDSNTFYHITDEGKIYLGENEQLKSKLDKTQITNCITEIPQDIKLELNNGTLTLKAGSKVYVPNGFEADGVTPKFEVKTIQSDITSNYGMSRTNCIVVVDENNLLQWAEYEKEGSGTTPTTEGIYYNTSTNTITSPASWFPGKASLPIAIITENAGSGTGYGVKSIDQIFNGFGYIGSTVFALPGVKGLSPNGRNEDSSLKSNIVENTQIITRVFSGIVDGFCMVSPNRQSYPISTRTFDSYTEENNLFTSSATNGIAFDIAKIVCNSSGKITSFTPKTTFHALDYNDAYTKTEVDSKLSGKADISLSNVSNTDIFNKFRASGQIYLKETYVSGASWYRIWSDNWCEQGGQVMGLANYQDLSLNVYFLKTMRDANYSAHATPINSDGHAANNATIRNHATIGLSVHTAWQGAEISILASWTVCGYI